MCIRDSQRRVRGVFGSERMEDADADLARAIAESLAEQQGEPEVRAPDPVRNEALVDNTDASMPGTRRTRNHERDRFRSFAGEASGNGFAQLFKPPVDLLYSGQFHEAKRKGTEELRYLVVNLQAVDEFASHTLNRDTWKNKQVRAVIKEACILWQFYGSEEQGAQFQSLYPGACASLPVVAILDPRTGQLLHHWAGMVQPNELYNKLKELMQSHPLEQLTRPAKRPKVLSLHSDADEEAALAAAIAASLADGPQAQVIEVKDTPHKSEPGQPELKPQLCCDEPPEPAAGGPNSTKLKIRLPDHSWVVRRFDMEVPIEMVRQFVRWKLPDARIREFELLQSYPAKSLNSTEQTLEQAGLKNAQLLANWIEDTIEL
eukprot:TRINITY_DN5240_c0_g1_i12.p1 TRINITY_DN5240_c0_g1~~TRINITY_DN5240_c0_g1_i12.p1  ORF type:complete len:375 (-),score=69.94 TRINITY_DN5240_c0_g1_i12:56-1180(-)